MEFKPRLMVTRAEPDAQAVASRIHSLGAHAIVAPLRVEEAECGPSPPETPDAIIATSARAFRLGLPLAEALLEKPCFVVGPATALAARASGFRRILEGAGHARALAEAVLQWAEPLNRILYLAGDPRKPDLEAVLRSAGIRVDLWLRYRMVPAKSLPQPAWQALEAGECDGVLHWSAESALTYAALIRGAGLEMQGWRSIQFCLSAAIAAALAEEARKTGFEPVIRVGPGMAGKDFVTMAIRDLRPMP